MTYVINKRDESGRWGPLVETTVGNVLLRQGQQLVYRDEKSAEQRVDELERSLSRESRRRGYSFRVIKVLRQDTSPPKHEWTATPTPAILASRKTVLEERLAALHVEQAKLTEEVEDILGYTQVECTRNCHGAGCGAFSPIRELIYIQTHWYVEPSGCTGGDYWCLGEGNFDCPHCGHRNRLYDRKPIEDLKRLFLGVANEHRE